MLLCDRPTRGLWGGKRFGRFPGHAPQAMAQKGGLYGSPCVRQGILIYFSLLSARQADR